jgi:hypothetical protein
MALGTDWSGVVSAVGGGVANAFNVAAQTEARAEAARVAAEQRSYGWSEAADIQRHERELAELDRQIQEEQERLLAEGRRSLDSEELRLLQERRRRAVSQTAAARAARDAALARRVRIPAWGWVAIGVVAIGGVFGLVAWRAAAQE